MPRFRAVLFDLFDTLCRIDEAIYDEGKRREALVLGLPPGPFASAWVASGDAAQVGLLPDIPARVRRVSAVLGAPEPAAALVERVTAIEVATLRAATAAGRARLRQELTRLWVEHNLAEDETTIVESEHMEVLATVAA